MSNQPTISIIAAIGQSRELGADNQLLWHIAEDAKHFKHLTTGHPIIMGRKTYESLPPKWKPLPDRTNIVITRQTDFTAPGATVVSSLAEALEIAKTSPGSEEIFIGGGGQIYAEALPLADRLYLTIVEKTFPEADTFFPDYANIFTKEISREQKENEGVSFAFLTLEK